MADTNTLPIRGAGIERPVSPFLPEDKGSSTPLHDAARTGDVKMLRKYLRSGSLLDVNSVDDWDRSPLHYAKTAAIAERLIEAGAKLNADNEEGQTPLHMAVTDRRLDVVQVLLSKGADENKANDDEKLPLDYAQECPAAGFMLENGCELDATDSGLDDAQGLSVMAWLGDAEGVAFFLSLGADVNATNDVGETALHKACHNGDEGIVQMLLSHGARKDVREERENQTPLLMAAKAGRIKAVDCLLRAGVDVAAENENGHTALSEAAWYGHWEVARLLIENDALVDSKDCNGNTILHCSVHRAPPQFTAYLIQEGALDETNGCDGTPLIEAIKHKKTAHALLLIEAGADVTKGDYAGSPLSRAAQYGNAEVLAAILKRVPQQAVSARAPNSWTPLAESCYHSHVDCVRLLLEAGADTETTNEVEGFTAMHQAVRKSEDSVPNPEVVRLLVAARARLEARDGEGRTPLAVACQDGVPEIVKELIKIGANTEARVRDDYEEHTPLLTAAADSEDDSSDMAKELIAGGANIEAKSKSTHATPINLAAENRCWKMVQMLLAAGADVNATREDRQTPLMLAVREGIEEEDREMDLEMDRQKIDDEERTDEIRLKIRAQVKARLRDVVKDMINRGANIKARDSSYRTAWAHAKHVGVNDEELESWLSGRVTPETAGAPPASDGEVTISVSPAQAPTAVEAPAREGGVDWEVV